MPKEVREQFGIKGGMVLRWVPLGQRIVGLAVEAEERGDYEDVLAFLERLRAHEVERLEEPDYSPVSKSELWLRASKG